MANDSIQIPTLFGGVSTQAAALRFPNQVESATNALLTVKDGAELRPGTRIEFAPAAGTGASTNQTLVTGKNYRQHSIKRDATEKYLVVYGRKQDGDNLALRVFEPNAEAAAQESTVTASADALTYLNLNNATADQIRMVTVADYTLILNTTVAAAASTSATYSIAKTHRDYNVMFSHTPANNTYHKTLNATAVESKGNYKYHLDAGSFPTWHRNVTTFSLAYFQDGKRSPGGFKVFMDRVACIQTSGKSGTTEGVNWFQLLDWTSDEFNAYTWVDGDYLHVTGGTGLTPGYYKITGKHPTISKAVILETTPGSSGASTDADATGIGIPYEVTVNFLTQTLVDHHDVARHFEDALHGAGCIDGLIEWFETDIEQGYFVITGKWRGLNLTVHPPTTPSAGWDYTAEGQSFRNLAATSVSGTGTIADEDKEVPVADRWTKVPPPNDPNAVIDPLTMPLKMVRTSVSSGATPAVFTVDTITWVQRVSGNNDTNPIPSLWDKGYKISDLSFHRNRLWFTGSENVVASQAGDYYNFFIEDSENIADADPIDATLPGDKVAISDFMVPFRKTLLILTKAGAQFELNAPETLTPNTATITATTGYTTLSVRPDSIGTKVYIAATAGGGTQLYEYYYNESASAADAADVSAHASGYLPTTVRTIRACPNDDTVLLLPTPGTELFVYRSFGEGEKKVQSAWSKYVFTGMTKICDIAMLDSRCYMLVDDVDGFRFTSFSVSQEPTPSGYSYGVRLDNMVSKTGVYVGATGVTTWTLTVPDGSVTHAVLPASTVIPLTKTNSTSYWATGDYSAAASTVGGSYTMTLGLSKFFRRDQNGASLLDMVLQLVKLVLNHRNSGSYSLTITQANRADRTLTFTPRYTTTTESDGTSSFYLLGNTRDTSMTITVTGPKPVVIVSGECAVTFNQLSR